MASISGVKNFIFISSTKAGVAEDSISSVEQAEGIYTIKESCRISNFKFITSFEYESECYQACTHLWS